MIPETALTIPTFSDPFYTVKVKLSGVEFLLYFQWSTREACWYLDFGTPAQWIARGIKIVTGVPLLWRFRHNPLTPRGMLIAADTGETWGPLPGRFDLGDRVKLIYIPPMAITPAVVSERA